MARILLAYSTVDGHTRSICERVQGVLEDAGHAVTLASLSAGGPPDAGGFDKVVIGASIRYGKHRPEVFTFIRQQQAALERRPSAFFTVNAVARKPGKDTPEGSPYIRSFRKLTTWRPALVGVFAGRIDYRRYGFVDRHVIRLIMWLTHGPTDPRACVEFTDWASVDAFARRVVEL
ncbi:menaquinone-dependent protoporphyrinogen IX dehydrogenase [Ramlibacter alkalitolerans]|uniref:Protoporphyrinogen IX dehydrogenase [quinone] n=1 Tax=Ramlibacter alkalitolerans TaxID=2039631 RepID=A0ABS1JJL9_9BURK|nr:menaquinone-dependent protoporphyrinogen IX dehydrogenase [Ramlibacter alkalitolerans]MBL0424423.1 menaquinone-dependent protoporphyrinogen IX dehydrogenase [Ramlibacter alkalitolerans]